MAVATKRKRTRKKANEGEWIYCPEGIDLADYGVAPELDLAARYFLNVIYYRRIIGNLDNAEYIPLHSALLIQVIGDNRKVAKTKAALVDGGLVECDEKYRPATASSPGKSTGYRLSPLLQDWQFRKWTIPGKRFAARVREFREWSKSPQAKFNELENWLFEWVKKVRWNGRFDDVYADVVQVKQKAAEQVTCSP